MFEIDKNKEVLIKRYFPFHQSETFICENMMVRKRLVHQGVKHSNVNVFITGNGFSRKWVGLF